MASQSHAAEVKKEPEAFTARSAVDAGMSAALITGGAGTFTSAIQNSLTTHKAGAMGVFTRTGKTIALFSGYHAACLETSELQLQLQLQLYVMLTPCHLPPYLSSFFSLLANSSCLGRNICIQRSRHCQRSRVG